MIVCALCMLTDSQSGKTGVGKERTSAHLGYHLCIKGAAVKSCYGCKRSFAQCYSKPPKDIIIRRFMQRQYKDGKTGVMMKSPRKSAAYFHMNINCLRKVTPHVNVKDVFVHEEIWPYLTGQRGARVKEFGLDIFGDVESSDDL